MTVSWKYFKKLITFIPEETNQQMQYATDTTYWYDLFMLLWKQSLPFPSFSVFESVKGTKLWLVHENYFPLNKIFFSRLVLWMKNTNWLILSLHLYIYIYINQTSFFEYILIEIWYK
jgi:hypothetical protein